MLFQLTEHDFIAKSHSIFFKKRKNEKNEITEVTCFFVDTSDVEKISLFLQSRFTNSPKFKGTRKNHQFIPYRNDIVTKRVQDLLGLKQQ